MRQRYEIFESLKSSFLSTQNSVNEVLPGSIINSLLYANSVELDFAFNSIDTIKSQMYIDTATGVNLDFLISGFARLSRNPEKYSVGYVLVELGTALTADNLNLLNFSFAKYEDSGIVNMSYPNVVTFSVNNKVGGTSSYVFVNPLNFTFSDSNFLVSSVNGSQDILISYREYLRILYNKYKKPIKYLILPIASTSGGSLSNVPSGSIDASVNLGFPCTITNPFIFSNAVKNAYAHLRTASVATDVIMADIDGVINGSSNSYGLENFSYISGGSDIESDDAYRSRYYSYLNSLSKGTIESINFAISREFPNFTFSIVETAVQGSLDVYVDTNYILSKPILERIRNSINEVKPAGIYINVKPAKNIFISAVADLVNTTNGNFIESTNFLKESFYDLVNAKQLSESLTYEELITLGSNSTTTRKDNVFYGEFLNESLFNMYKETFQKLYAKFNIKADVVASTQEYWKSTSFYDVYNTIVSKQDSVFIAYKNSNLKYPLVGLVKKALQMTEQEKTPLNSVDLALVNLIQTTCTTVKPSQCLAKIIPNSNSYNENLDIVPVYDSFVNISNIAINLGTLSRIVGPEYANYYKVKLLTIPFIRKETEENALPLIKRIISNDVVYFSYDELIEVSLSALEKIKAMRDINISQNLYSDSTVFAARPIEK